MHEGLRSRSSMSTNLFKGSDIDDVLARARASKMHTSVNADPTDVEGEAAKVREYERRLKASMVDACRNMLPQRTEALKLFELMKGAAIREANKSAAATATAASQIQQMKDDDFDPSCVICWSYHQGGRANDAAANLLHVPAHVREGVKSRSGGVVDLDSKKGAFERAILLQSSGNAGDALRHWKAMHLHATLDKRQALENALQDRERSSSSVNKNSRQLASLSSAAMASGHAWAISQSAPSSSSQRLLEKVIHNTAQTKKSGGSPSKRPVSTSLPPVRGAGHDSPPLHPTTTRPTQLPELNDEEARFLGEYMGQMERERDLVDPTSKRRESGLSSDTGAASQLALVKNLPSLASRNNGALSSLGQKSTLRSMWTRPEQEMIVARNNWNACQVFWTRLTILCAGIQFPASAVEATVLSQLNTLIQQSRKVTRSLCFVWLRALCQPIMGIRSGNPSRRASLVVRTSSRNRGTLPPQQQHAADSEPLPIVTITHTRRGYRLFTIVRVLLGISSKAFNEWLDLPAIRGIPSLRKFPRDQEPLN